MRPQDPRWKAAAAAPKKPVPYKEGDKVEVRTKGYPQKIKVEDKVTIRGKPGFIGQDLDTGATVRDFDENVVKVVKPQMQEYPYFGVDLPGNQQYASEEILNLTLNGKVVHEEIRKFLRILTVRGQEVANLVSDARKHYETKVQQPADRPMTTADLEKAILKTVIRQHFGDDPLAKMLAHVIATGDYLF